MTGAWLQAVSMEPSPEDRELIRRAAGHLEDLRVAAQLSSLVGGPVEVAVQRMPWAWYGRMRDLAERAIGKAYDSVIEPPAPKRDGLSRGGGATRPWR